MRQPWINKVFFFFSSSSSSICPTGGNVFDKTFCIFCILFFFFTLRALILLFISPFVS